MIHSFLLLWIISFGIQIQYLIAYHHLYNNVDVEGSLSIQWLNLGTGNEAWCSVWCLWNNCPGFKVVNQSCHLLMENQTLPIATKSNGTSLYIRSELIQQVETAVLYNSRDFYEFIPEDSPLEGFRMTIPDPPMISAPILMNYPWGLHLCYVVTKSCYRWYFGTDHWIPMQSLNHPHANIREVINVNQTWWILGGFIDPQGNGISNSPHRISEFLTESGRWVRGHEYMERYQEGLAKISDMTILAVGGARASANLSSVLRDVDEYNVLTGETSSLGLTSCPITGTTCLNFKAQNGTEMILCLGGICSVPEREFQTKVFVLNLEAKAWMEMPEWEFPKTIRFATLAWVNGYLYVLRGVYEESDFLAVYKFDETSDPVWRLIELPPDHPPNHSRVLTFNRSVIFT